MDWFVENAEWVGSLASVAMLGIWTFYTVLFYREFRRQRTGFLVIHQAQGSGLDSTALIVNLSREPVHIVCVMFALHATRGTLLHRIQNLRRASDVSDGEQDVPAVMRQGPIAPGSFLGLGSFQAAIEAALEDQGSGTAPDRSPLMVADVHEIEIRVIALHGAHARPIGASRTFRVRTGDAQQVVIEPSTLLARQLSSRAESRVVEQWFRDCSPNGGPADP